MIELQDFPPYTLRKSARARHLQLRITGDGQLELVVPKRVSSRVALNFLKLNYEWVLSRQHLIQPPVATLREKDWPAEIYLKAIDVRFALQFKKAIKQQRICESIDEITLYLREFSTPGAVILIKRWLKQKAQLEITPWLQRLSAGCGLSYEAVTYRGQQRQWGNCSRDRRICLNYKLLFLPEEYVNYVLYHELCHTVHFNHSAEFWDLLSRFISDWRTLRRNVRRANEFLPLWLR